MTDIRLRIAIRIELALNTLGATSWQEGEEFLHDKIQADANIEFAPGQWDRVVDLLIEAGDLTIN